jgi:thiamine-phosphate pyrophosphorylase
MGKPQSAIVRDYFAHLGRGDAEAAFATAREDIVLDMTRSQAPWRGVSRGRAEAIATYRNVREAWDEFCWDLLDLRDLGRGGIAVRTRIHGAGAKSGIEIEAVGGWLVTVTGDELSEAVLFQTFEEALGEARRRAFAAARLYFVCDALPGGNDPGGLLEAALRGGVDVIQLREEAPRCAEELISFSEPFARAAREHGALFILNDRPDLVEACGADGVHGGQEDDSVAEARAQAGPAAVVGLSTHSVEQVEAARSARGAGRADQISVGPVWETPTKEGRPATGLGLIEDAAGGPDDPPWFAIGGIDAGNVSEVVAAGAKRIVVVRAIRDAEDPEGAARELRAALPD